jgi:hypothetical protein
MNYLKNAANLLSMKNIVGIVFLTLLATNSFAQVYKFSSVQKDLFNNPDQIEPIQTNEITHHTFDFNKRVIIFEGENASGNPVTIKYDMQSFHKETPNPDLSAQTGIDMSTWVIVVRQKEIKEIWFCIGGNNLGYVFTNGASFIFWGIKRIN